MTDETYKVTAGELRGYIESLERIDGLKKDLGEQTKEIMAQAKSRGYDTKILRKIVALRKLDPQEISEAEAVLELYKDALGI